MAHGLPSQALWPFGRDPTSMAFFSAPGTDRLSSGVTNSTASALLTRALNATAAGGGLASRSALKSGRSPISTISSFIEGRSHCAERHRQLAVERLLAQASHDHDDVPHCIHQD